MAALVLRCGTWNLSLWYLVFWPRIEPRLPTLGAQSVSHWTTREVPNKVSVYVRVCCFSLKRVGGGGSRYAQERNLLVHCTPFCARNALLKQDLDNCSFVILICFASVSQSLSVLHLLLFLFVLNVAIISDHPDTSVILF